MTSDPTASSSAAPVHGPLWGALLAFSAGLVALGFALLEGSLEPALPIATRIAGAALGGSTLALLFASFKRDNAVDLSSGRVLGSLAFGAFSALLGASAGNAVPTDLNLFTLGRPPMLGSVLPVVALLIGLLGSRSILRGASPRRIFLYLLVPALTLEGLPLATPAWVMLSLAGGACLVANASRPIPLFASLCVGLLTAVFAVCAALGADPGTSLDVVIRVAALSITLLILIGEGAAGARTAIGVTLIVLLGIAALGAYAKFALSQELAGIDAQVRSSGLSLFGRHPNLLASWFAATALIALHVALHRDDTHRNTLALRALGWLALPASMTMLALTASRLAIVAAVIAGCLPWITRFRITRRAIGIATALVLVLTASVFTLPALREKFTTRANLERSVDHRSFRIGVGFETALASPLLGHGPRCWFVQGAHTPPSYFVGETSSDHPHCLPIAVLQGTGVLGVGAFLLFLAFGAYAARRALQRAPSDWPLARGVLLAAIAQLLSNLLDMGDALETLVPSRLFLDVGILAAFAYDGAGEAGSAASWRSMTIGSLACVLASIVGLSLAFATRGRTLTRVGLPSRAITEFERSLRLVPFAADVHLDLATASFTASKRAAARDHLERAIELAPGRPDLHEALANLRSGTDNLPGALESARRAFELDPHGSTPRRLALFLGDLEIRSGERSRALNLVATAMRIDVRSLERIVDPDVAGRFRLGGTTLTLDEVIAAYDAAYPEIDARLKGYRLVREIELALLVRDVERAQRAQQELEKTQPESATTFKFAAMVARAAGRFEDALRAIDESISRYPTDPILRAERADLLLATGAQDDVIGEYRKSFPNAFDVYFQTNGLHEALSRLERAQAARGLIADRIVTARALAFFKRTPEERAIAFCDLAELLEAEKNASAARDAAVRALREILSSNSSEPNRVLARRIGTKLGNLGKSEADRSGFADSLERLAFSRAPGLLTLEFHAAFLRELGLERRAQAAQSELSALQR